LFKDEDNVAINKTKQMFGYTSNQAVRHEDEWYEPEPCAPFKFNAKKLMSFAGPGLLMSIAYMDPGNIAGDLDAGVKGQYSLIWTLFWSTVLGWYY